MFDRDYNGLDNDEYQGVDPGPVFWDGDSYGTNRIEERTAIPASVTLSITGTNDAGNLTLNVAGEFLAEYTHDLGVSLWITEDSIETTSQAGASGTWTHRYTIRDAISERLGDAITTTTGAGDTYSADYTFTVDPSWNVNQLYLVAMVNNMNAGDVNDREIQNAVQVKLTDLQAASVSDLDNKFNIYPNPVNNILNITNAQNADVKIYNILGDLVISKNNIGKTQNINTSNLPEGTYFVKISKNNTVETKKVIISR